MLPLVALAFALALPPAEPLRGPTTEGLTFSADGKLLFAPNRDDTGVHVWDAATGKRLPDALCPKADTDGYTASAVIAGGRMLRAISHQHGGGKRAGEVHAYSLTDGAITLQLYADDRLRYFASHYQHSTPACVSADGNTLAFTNFAGTQVAVWDLGRNKLLCELEPDSPAWGVELSGDGKTALTFNRPALQVWDTATGKARPAFTIDGSSELVRVSAGGKRAAGKTSRPAKVEGDTVTDTGLDPFLLVWDLAKGEQAAKLPLGCNALDFKFVGDDTLLVYGMKYGDDGSQVGFLSRWDVTTGKRTWETEWTVPPWVVDMRDAWVAVSPDGRRCAVSNRGTSAELFDAATGRRLSDAAGETGREVRAVGWSADGKTVFAVGADSQTNWDAATGKPGKPLPLPDRFRGQPSSGVVNGVVLFTLKTKDGAEVVAWDVAAGKEVWRITPAVKHVNRTLTADGKTVLLLGGAKATGTELFEAWDGPAGKSNGTWTSGLPAALNTPMALTPDGKQLWTAGRESLSTTHASGDGPTTLPAAMTTDSARDGQPSPILFSADGKQVVTFGGETGVCVTPVEKAAAARRFTGVKVTMTAAVVRPDGARVAAFSRQASKVWVYDLGGKDDQTPAVFDGGGPAATAVAFSPDGKRLAVVYADGAVRVWDVPK